MTDLDPLALEHRPALPDALRVLVEALPRADWPAHENFGGLVAFWLQRHMMFRQLTEVLQQDVQGYLDGRIGFQTYAPRLSQYGGALLNELHAHHHIEDSQYFPHLIRLDARLERGFGLLEADHVAMDGLLHGLAGAANAVLGGGPDAANAAALAGTLERFTTLLDRHLVDEEEIVVPVVLASGFAG